MAVTAGGAWNAQTVADNTFTEILSEIPVQEVFIGCDLGSAASLRVRVRNMRKHTHSTSEYAIIGAEKDRTFYGTPDNPIVSVLVAGNGGTATFSGTVTCP